MGTGAAHLHLLDDVLVVQAPDGLPAWPGAGRQPPALGGALHHVVMGLVAQRVHLAVQVHGDGDGAVLGCGAEQSSEHMGDVGYRRATGEEEPREEMARKGAENSTILINTRQPVTEKI